MRLRTLFLNSDMSIKKWENDRYLAISMCRCCFSL
jgi:hypothetical protein